MSLLDLDPRWRRFNDTDYTCPCCGQSFGGVFDIAYDHPACWPHDALSDSGQDVLQVGEDKLSADLCRLGAHRFIRCVLPLPIRGCDERFYFGPWASVAPETFDRYVTAWHQDDWSGFPQNLGWLANELPGFESDGAVACDLITGDGDARPGLRVHQGPLAEAQGGGISFDQLLDIYAATGTDLRPHLRGA